MANSSGTGGPTSEDFTRLKDTITAAGAEVEMSLVSNINQLFRAGTAARKAATASVKDLTAELTRASAGLETTKLRTEGITTQLNRSKQIEESIAKIKTRQSNIESNLLLLEKQGVVLSQKDLDNIRAIADALKEQLGIEEELLDKARLSESQAGKIAEIFKGISKIPILNKLVDTERVLAKIKKTADETGSRWQALGVKEPII